MITAMVTLMGILKTRMMTATRAATTGMVTNQARRRALAKLRNARTNYVGCAKYGFRRLQIAI
jgi:hypothetical protein